MPQSNVELTFSVMSAQLSPNSVANNFPKKASLAQNAAHSVEKQLFVMFDSYLSKFTSWSTGTYPEGTFLAVHPLNIHLIPIIK